MPDGTIEIEVELNSDKAKKELNQLSKTLDTETKKAAKSAENATKQAAKSAEAAAKEASKIAEQSAKQAGKTAATSAKQAGEKASQSTKKSGEEQKRSYKQTEQQAKRSAENAERYWSGAAGKIKSAVSTGMKATGAAVIAGGTASLKASISFESAFAGVKKTVNATDKELATMRKDILNMSKEMPTSANEIAGVAEAAGQLGIKTKNIAGFSKTMVMLGDSTNMSADTAATSLARLANITGMPQTQFDRLGSTIVDLGNNLATTEQEITDMALRLAGAGSQVGMSEADILSFAGALSSVGIEAESGGSAFSTLMSKMKLATTTGGEDLQAFAQVAGMSSDQFAKEFKEDAAGAIISFIQGLDNVNKNGGSAIKTLDDMGLSDIRMRDALLRAAGASGTFTKALKIGNNAWKENKALTNEAKQRYKTLESRIKMLGNKFVALGIAVGDELKGPLADGVAAASDAIGGLADQVEAHGLKSIIPKETITTVKNLGSAAKTVAGGGLKVLGSAAKFLGENMQTALPLATSLLVVLKGYKVAQAVSGSVSALGTALKALNALEKANAITLVAQQGGLTALQTVVGIFTGKITLATAATGAFNAACTALGGPIGMAVLAAGALTAGIAAYAIATDKGVSEEERLIRQHEKSVASYKKLSKELLENKKSRESAITSAENEGATAEILSRKLQGLMKQEHKSAGTKEQIKSIVQQLNQILPDLGLAYDNEKDKLNQSTSAIQRNIKAQRELSVAKAYAAQNEKVAEDIIKTEKDLTKYKKEQKQAEDDLAEATRKREETERKFKEDPFHTSGTDVKIAEREEKELKKINDEKLKLVGDTQKKINELNGEIDSNIAKSTALTNYVEFTNNIDKLAQEAGIKASKIPESIGNGIKDGIYTNPASGEELLQLIDVDNLLSKAGEAGVKIPEYLAQGLSSGSISFKAAADQLTKGLNYEKLYADAFGSGQKIPESVAAGIQSGQYAVPTSTTAMENLVTFDDLKAKALNGGVQIPEYLANGITSGSMKPKEAAAALGNLMDFQEAINKAGLQGAQIPTELATKVAQGKTSVDNAVIQMMSGQGLSTDAFGVMNVIDGVAKSTGDSAKKIETNMKVNPVDNSGAASSSFKPFKTESSKASGETKKNTDSIKKNSKIPATNNAGAGKKTESSYTNELSKGAGKAKAATKKVSSSAVNGFSGGDSKAKAAGAKLSSAYVSGISSKSGQATAKGKELSSKTASGVTANKGKIKTAAQNAVNGAKKVSTGGFTTVGKNISTGIASGIDQNSGVVSSAARRVIQQAKTAANDEADSHSPSRVFRDQVGKFLPLGVAVGIRKNTGEAVKASVAMTRATLNAATKDLGIHSPSRKFRDIVGKNIPRGIAKGIKAEQKSVISATKKMIASLEKTAKNPNGKFEETGKNFVEKFETVVNKKKDSSIKSIKNLVDTQVKALKKQNKKQSSNYTKAGKSIVNAYTKAITNETKKLVSKAEKEIEDLSKKYQEKYDKIISLRDSLKDKQKDYGNIYDLKQNIADLEQYQKNLKALENKIPDSMMERILGMDIDSATEYMEWFRSLSKTQQKAYTDSWKKQQSMSESFSKSFFADDISKLNKEYSNAINKATANLEKQMKQIGKNLMKGMASGMKSETKNLNKTTKSICNKVIKAAKKAFDIHSPSKEFAKIGKFNMKGTEVGQEKEAKKLYTQLTEIADTMMETMAQRFARAQLNIPDIQSRMQSAVTSQMARISANVNPQLVAADGRGTTVIEKTVYTGPEKIEIVTTLNGREIARGSAPYMNREFESIAKHQERGG